MTYIPYIIGAINLGVLFFIAYHPDKFIAVMDWLDDRMRSIVEKIMR